MLILSRKINQSIIINDNIEIHIVNINQEQVKIGIKAPRNVTVHRKEIYETIKNEMEEAATSSITNISNLKKIKKIKSSEDENNQEI